MPPRSAFFSLLGVPKRRPELLPPGGYRYRRFGWDGARFVVRSEQVLPRLPAGFYRTEGGMSSLDVSGAGSSG